MKKIIITLTVLLIIIVSCGEKVSKAKNLFSKKGLTEKIAQMADTGNCDEFINDYEKWVDNMIVIVKKAKANPDDATVQEEMMKSSQKMAEWSQKWITLYACAADEKYAKRMEELQKRVATELGEE